MAQQKRTATKPENSRIQRAVERMYARIAAEGDFTARMQAATDLSGVRHRPYFTADGMMTGDVVVTIADFERMAAALAAVQS